MIRHRCTLVVACLLTCLLTVSVADAQRKKEPRKREDAKQRADALRAICGQLEVGAGKVIADIGAGNGRDTWTFASVVGETGKVFSEEIAQGKCDTIEKGAKERKLTQVQTVLGTPTSPELPVKSVDMAFMHHVYHHVSKPQEMLRGIWHSLKPGGYLVIVDQRLGTLTDWVAREERAKKHYWIAETTVVREARENGYAFVDFAESLWHTKGSFVLIFQRPTDLEAPTKDPDALPPIAESVVGELLGESPYQRVAFIALGEGRTMIGPFVKSAQCEAIDIVLEEWATRKDERPTQPEGITLPSVLTEKGDPQLGSEPIDAVLFLDTYHLLFHSQTLLTKLNERLTDDGHVFVLDREAYEELSHREASHRRKISIALVKKEMEQAGFAFERSTLPSGRFLLVFSKAK